MAHQAEISFDPDDIESLLLATQMHGAWKYFDRAADMAKEAKIYFDVDAKTVGAELRDFAQCDGDVYVMAFVYERRNFLIVEATEHSYEVRPAVYVVDSSVPDGDLGNVHIIGFVGGPLFEI